MGSWLPTSIFYPCGPPGFRLIRQKIVQFSTRINLSAGRTFLADAVIAMDLLSISAIFVMLAARTTSALSDARELARSAPCSQQ